MKKAKIPRKELKHHNSALNASLSPKEMPKYVSKPISPMRR